MSLDHAIKTTPGGRVSLKTAEGELLIAAESGNTLTITDHKGNTARVTIPDVYQSNGVIMVITQGSDALGKPFKASPSKKNGRSSDHKQVSLPAGSGKQ
jgi:hypothetical protein